MEFNSVILPKNTQVPAKFTNEYCTTVPFQEKLYIQVTQGEEEDLRYVTVIGTAEIEIMPREKLLELKLQFHVMRTQLSMFECMIWIYREIWVKCILIGFQILQKRKLVKISKG